MASKEMIRMKKFLVALDDCMTDSTYYDDEKQTDVCEMSESEVYDYLMQTEEFHLLTSETVKQFIHMFQDFSVRMATLKGFGIQ